MKIALICTGSELLSGKVNTNAAYIGSRLSEMGLGLASIVDIADNKEDLTQELKRAFEKNSIIITTGGLGPTFDDITVETVAKCLGLEIYIDEKVLQQIKDLFEKRGIKSIPKVNERQANIIKGAKVLENRYGTAPGQMIHFQYVKEGKSLRKTIFLLPGPPREMQPMFEENVEPLLKSYFSGIKKNEIIHVFGMPESEVEEIIKPVIEAVSFGGDNSVEFGILAHRAVIDIKFSVSGNDELLVDEAINNLKYEFENALKDNIFGYGKESLESIVGKLLIESKKTLSFAESCTGGLLSKKITDIAGSSAFFKGSIVSYANDIKESILKVNKETLENFGAVSQEAAKEMAECVLKLLNTDFSVAITGIAGPGGGSKEKPTGLVFIAIASKKDIKVYKYNFSGVRKDIRQRAANTALDLLRRKIIKETEKPRKNSFFN